MTPTSLIEFFEQRHARGERLVLGTVVDTRGSTYSKAGAQMLIDSAGRFRGMLSGGCLEGDLAVRANVVLESGKPMLVTYDLAKDDELWGLGVGCDGMMRILLQPIDDAGEPFKSVRDVLVGDEPATVVVPVDPPVDVDGTLLSEFGVDVTPLPRVLVAGAGPDAEPLVRFCAELGWRCTVVDHRPAYIDGNDFSNAERAVCLPAEELSSKIDLSKYDLAVVMSHHLVSDRAYLSQLADTSVRYIGLLGPPGRRQRLLEDLGERAAALAGRLHGPAGLDIGGRGPASIALSIVAEMHSHHFGKAF